MCEFSLPLAFRLCVDENYEPVGVSVALESLMWIIRKYTPEIEALQSVLRDYES